MSCCEIQPHIKLPTCNHGKSRKGNKDEWLPLWWCYKCVQPQWPVQTWLSMHMVLSMLYLGERVVNPQETPCMLGMAPLEANTSKSWHTSAWKIARGGPLLGASTCLHPACAQQMDWHPHLKTLRRQSEAKGQHQWDLPGLLCQHVWHIAESAWRALSNIVGHAWA